MVKPIFLRDKNGKIVKTIRPTPRPKKSTGRPVGFNASRDGFQTAPPIKPVAPIPSSNIHSVNREFVVDPTLSSDEIDKRKAQFDLIKKLNEQRLVDSLKAYKEYKDIAKEYSNSITSGEHEPLNPEAAKLAPLVTDAYVKLARFKLSDEHINTMMDRLAYESYLKDYADRNEQFKEARRSCLEELKTLTDNLDKLDDGDEDSDARKVYLQAQEAREACRKKLFTMQYENASKNLDFSTNDFELYTDSVISDLGDSGEIDVDDEDLAKNRANFWQANREYELATFDLLTYRGGDTEEMKELEEESKRHKERILAIVESNYERLDDLLMAKSTHSEEAESEETYQISLHRDFAKKELAQYRGETKGV